MYLAPRPGLQPGTCGLTVRILMRLLDFDGRSRNLRDECLNVHWFETLEDAKMIIKAWRRDYNETRPHMALNDVAPEVYARQKGALNTEN